MNKLQMAHQMALMLLKNAPLEEVSNAISTAWQYADAMQAEADKRVIKLPDVFFDTKQSDGEQRP